MQKREMTNDIQTLKEHVAVLQSGVKEGRTQSQAVGDVQQKNLATTQAEMERVNQDIKRIKGDIDSLKVGVTMGQMPGQEAAQDSVAAKLVEIQERLERIEGRVSELSSTGTSKKPGAVKVSANADSESIVKAYERKRYAEVIQDAPGVLRKVKGKDREQVLNIYGESLYRTKKYKEAALQFNEILESKPSDAAAASAKLRVADSFKAMGDKDTSKLFYEEVLTKYPDSPEAAKAKKALGKK
jgi:tetratricopeptide (TPR) repeat protein